MWSCRARGVWLWWWWGGLVLVLAMPMMHGCGPSRTGPAVDPKIDFDQYRSAVPSQAHCPGQGDLLTEMEAWFAEKAYARALHLAADIIAAPCTRENYTRAVKVAGDVFAARQEYDQAFYYYLEGLSHAVDAEADQMFYDRLQQAAMHLPPKQVAAMTEAANARVLERVTLMRESEPEAPEFLSRRIGVMLPLSGYYQAGGERALNGIQMAVNQQNRSGGRPFELHVQDTRSDPAGVAAAVQRLEKTGAACIVGPMVTAGPAAVQARILKIPMITLTQQMAPLETGDYIFRNFLTPDDQVRALVSYVMDDSGYDRFAVFYPDENYGHVYKQAFLQAVEDRGGQVTAQVVYAPDQTDFSAQIKPLIRGFQKLDTLRRFVDLEPGEPMEKNRIYQAKIDFDAVFIPDEPETAAQISLQLKFHGIRQVMLLGTNIWNPAALEQVAGQALHPAIFPVAFDPDSPKKAVHDFVTDYEAAFGETPDYFAAIGFETAMLVMACLADPGVTSRAELMQALEAVGFDRNITLDILGADI